MVAAAVQGRADLIVTANLKDFPAEVLGRFNLQAQDPDEFFMNQFDLDPAQVMRPAVSAAADTPVSALPEGPDPVVLLGASNEPVAVVPPGDSTVI